MTYTIIFGFKNGRDVKLTSVPLEATAYLQLWRAGKSKRNIFMHDNVYINLDDVNLVAVTKEDASAHESGTENTQPSQ